MRASGRTICKTGWERIIGSTEKSNTRSSRTFIKAIGLMEKGMALEASFIQMVVDMRVTLSIIKSMGMDWRWMIMGISSWSFFKGIS